MTQVIQSGLTLLDYGVKWGTGTLNGVQLYEGLNYSYAALYRTQPNVRTCVDFLARNVAQLGLHVYRRVSNTDRQRLTAQDHELARLIERPNPWTTTYRLIEALISDMAIYWNHYWLKIEDEIAGLKVIRIPPELVTPLGTGNAPSAYQVSFADGIRIYQPDEIVHFRGYNPDDARMGLSPLETLRRVLAEEQAMGDYRENFWKNSARMNGLIERPKDAPTWSADVRKRFMDDWKAAYSGAANSGATGLLEDGMTWKQMSFNAQESEYLGGRKLTREECARAYHIPLPMVGILDHATFSNVKEQHKNLYQDCLGPWLRMVEEDIELQVLSEMPERENVYCEFNIDEKLAGSFEEQMSALNSAIGRPYMTPNEGRAKLNLPAIEGGDSLGLPLNMASAGTSGGADSGADTGPKSAPEVEFKASGRIDPTRMQLRKRYAEKWAEVLAKYFRRQGQTMRSRAGDGNIDPATLWVDKERWKKELKEELFRLGIDTAWAWASYVAAIIEAHIAQEPMEAYVLDSAERTAGYLTDATERDTVKALSAEDPKEALGQVFETLATVTAVGIGLSQVTQMANFGSHEGARQGGLKTKTWQVNSVNPRPDHAALNGATVNLDDIFYQTGQRWPGDPAGGAENCSNCQCSVIFRK